HAQQQLARSRREPRLIRKRDQLARKRPRHSWRTTVSGKTICHHVHYDGKRRTVAFDDEHCGASWLVLPHWYRGLLLAEATRMTWQRIGWYYVLATVLGTYFLIFEWRPNKKPG